MGTIHERLVRVRIYLESFRFLKYDTLSMETANASHTSLIICKYFVLIHEHTAIHKGHILAILKIDNVLCLLLFGVTRT